LQPLFSKYKVIKVFVLNCSLEQTCDAVVAFASVFPERRRCQEATDKLWTGIVERAGEINVDTIASVYRTLPHFRTSRDIVLGLVEQRVGADNIDWRSYRPRAVLEILRALTELQWVKRHPFILRGSDKEFM